MIITRTPWRLFWVVEQIYRRIIGKMGEILSATIGKYLYITCRRMPPFWDFKHRFVYDSKTELMLELDEIEHSTIRETMRYLNIDYGVDLHYNTDILARFGIGSSASFTVGLLNALNGLNGKMTSKMELARNAIYIEQNLIQEVVGSLNQTAAAIGGLNHMIFKQNGEIEVHPVTIFAERRELLNKHWCIAK